MLTSDSPAAVRKGSVERVREGLQYACTTDGVPPIEKTMCARLAIAALFCTLILSTPAYAALPLDAGASQVLTGRVLEVLPQHLLVVQAGTRRVLVYANAGSSQLGLRSGQTIRIEGEVPRDWLQLSTDELQARRIEVLN